MTQFEYVNKREYQPVKREIEDFIRSLQKMMKEYGITYDFRLIGSGKEHLITRAIGSNKGYDFDYNLIIRRPEKGYVYNASVIKEVFFDEIKDMIKGSRFNAVKNPKSVITIKAVDRKNSKVLCSCDIAIVYYEDEDDPDSGYRILKRKPDNSYVFELRKKSLFNDEKLEAILDYNPAQRWERIRKEYIKLKNQNQVREKRSHSLYCEAVNNVYNQIRWNDDFKSDNNGWVTINPYSSSSITYVNSKKDHTGTPDLGFRNPYLESSK